MPFFVLAGGVVFLADGHSFWGVVLIIAGVAGFWTIPRYLKWQQGAVLRGRRLANPTAVRG